MYIYVLSGYYFMSRDYYFEELLDYLILVPCLNKYVVTKKKLNEVMRAINHQSHGSASTFLVLSLLVVQTTKVNNEIQVPMNIFIMLDQN